MHRYLNAEWKVLISLRGPEEPVHWRFFIFICIFFSVHPLNKYVLGTNKVLGKLLRQIPSLPSQGSWSSRRVGHFIIDFTINCFTLIVMLGRKNRALGKCIVGWSNPVHMRVDRKSSLNDNLLTI